MTTVRETRLDHEGKPYTAIVPLHMAGDTVYRDYVADTVREFLHRQGISAAHMTTDALLGRVRNSFHTGPSLAERQAIADNLKARTEGGNPVVLEQAN